VKGAPSGTLNLRRECSCSVRRHRVVSSRRAARLQCCCSASVSHTRNGSFGSEVSVILNVTFDLSKRFGGLARL
jgi:hypothetical protein